MLTAWAGIAPGELWSDCAAEAERGAQGDGEPPGGAKGEQRLPELQSRHKPKFVNEDGQPFDPKRDQVKLCDNNERLGAVCCHKLRSSDAKAEFEIKTKLYAWVEVAAAEGRKKRRSGRSAACPMACATRMLLR